MKTFFALIGLDIKYMYMYFSDKFHTVNYQGLSLFSFHRYAIILGSTTSYESLQSQILLGFKYKVHIYTLNKRSRDCAVVRALASHHCAPGSIPGPGIIYGLSLLLVLYSALRGFSLGTSDFPSL